LKTAQDAPPLKLLFELFEARELAKDLLKAETLINKLLQEASSDSIITREQLLYRRGILLKNLGRKTDARQSFENAKTLAPESVWGKLSNTELQALDL
jgi:lipoprotein NlpI